jgi:hypothetical protein
MGAMMAMIASADEQVVTKMDANDQREVTEI